MHDLSSGTMPRLPSRRSTAVFELAQRPLAAPARLKTNITKLFPNPNQPRTCQPVRYTPKDVGDGDRSVHAQLQLQQQAIVQAQMQAQHDAALAATGQAKYGFATGGGSGSGSGGSGFGVGSGVGGHGMRLSATCGACVALLRQQVGSWGRARCTVPRG